MERVVSAEEAASRRDSDGGRQEQPPAFPTRVMEVFLADEGVHVLGDLVEEYRHRCETRPARLARRWYWSQVARSIAPLGWHRVNAAAGPQTVVAVALALMAMTVWMWVLNLAPVRFALGRVVGSAPSFVLVVLEMSGLLVAGAVLGRLALRRLHGAVILTGVVSLAMPVLAGLLTTGRPGPTPGLWLTLLVFGALELGAAASHLVGRS